MQWTQLLDNNVLAVGETCRLILVGETKDGQPYCYEDSFRLQSLEADKWIVSLSYSAIHPLEKLHHVGFVEFSFREQGLLYYGFCDMLSLEMLKSSCMLTLSAPDNVLLHQRRKSPRIRLPSRIPITCRIVGVRGQLHSQSVVFYGQMVELSASNVSFVTTARLFDPLLLELSFHLPHAADKLLVVCEVIRVMPFGSDAYRVAAEFRSCPQSVAEQLERFCQTHLTTREP